MGLLNGGMGGNGVDSWGNMGGMDDVQYKPDYGTQMNQSMTPEQRKRMMQMLQMQGKAGGTGAIGGINGFLGGLGSGMAMQGQGGADPNMMKGLLGLFGGGTGGGG